MYAALLANVAQLKKSRCMTKFNNRAFIGIGSNLGDSIAHVQLAVTAIDALMQCKVVNASSFYTSKPMGPQDQPDYCNAVIEICHELTPLELLDALQHIELTAGRERKDERWGPRTLDLDIILFNDLEIHTERLTIPHYGMKVREFVLMPLHEIAPDLILPDGDNISHLCNNIDSNGLLKNNKIKW